MRVIMMQENVEFDNGKNEGDEITSFAEEEVCLNYLHNHDGLIIIIITTIIMIIIITIIIIILIIAGEAGGGGVVRPCR